MSGGGTSPGEIFVLSAPSGTGKTSLIRSLLDSGLADLGGLHFAVSHTTRSSRNGEVDGRDYYFVNRDRFRADVAADRFLEWAEVHGEYYGTSCAEVLPYLERGVDVILDVDVQGAEQVLTQQERAHGIFLMPPSREALEKRLRQRDLDDPEAVARRLAVSHSEIRRYKEYNYVIINRDLERAAEVLAAIILEKRHRLDRMNTRIQSVLEEFLTTEA